MEVVESLQGFVEENLSLLSPVDQAWQPTDFLPDLTARRLDRTAHPVPGERRQVSDDVLVVLVGNMVTEEALPNYAVSLEQIAKDPTGTGDAPWARWLRGWTAEENRHGDLLNAYLRLAGRVDMRSVERTIHELIRNGFNNNSRGNDYEGLIYASFQERATRISHGNVAKLVADQGEENLARICRKIAADETRHEVFYTRVVGELMERDPEGAVLAYRQILRGIISMPARLMSDGKDPDLYEHYAMITQRLGVYTARDYAGIIAHLNEAWDIGHRSVSGKAAKAQEYLCRQPERYEHLADEVMNKCFEAPAAQYSWIHDRSA